MRKSKYAYQTSWEHGGTVVRLNGKIISHSKPLQMRKKLDLSKDQVESILAKIKKILIREAIAFKLEGDITQFDTDVLLPAFGLSKKELDKEEIYKSMDHYLSQCEDDYETIVKTLKRELKKNPDKDLDDVKGVTVWEPLESTFTVKSFCQTVGIK